MFAYINKKRVVPEAAVSIKISKDKGVFVLKSEMQAFLGSLVQCADMSPENDFDYNMVFYHTEDSRKLIFTICE